MSSSKFYRFLVDLIRNKVKSHSSFSTPNEKSLSESSLDNSENYSPKYVLIGCHDSTICSYLTAIGQRLTKSVALGEAIFIELYKSKNQYYLSWNFAGKYLDVNSKCDELGG